jgi:hypothetical protein
VEDAAPQEGVGQLLLVVAGDDHQRPLFGHDVGGRSRSTVKRICVELEQEIVGELEVGLVDLVDQQHDGASAARNAWPQRPELDVLADVAHVAVAEAAVVQALHRVVDVQPVLGLGGRLDVPAPWARRQRR